MAWLSSTTLAPSDPLTNVNLNNLALDIQNWGGNVNGGGYSLFNCSIAGVLSDPTTTLGDLLVKGPGTPGVITRLPVGADGLALVADHTQTLGVKWGAPGGGLVDPTTAKGDLIVKPQTGPPVRLPIGTDNQLLLADSSQVNGLRWATITEFAAPGSDTQVTFNKLGVPSADSRLAFNYNGGHLLIGGQADDGSTAVLQVAGVTHTTMRVRTDQFLSAKAYANPSSLNIPDAGYGAWGYQGGSVYYYWNGSAFVSADISRLGTGLVDPTTTLGDLIVRGNAGTTRFPVGTANGQVLEVDSTQPTGIRWVTPPPSGVSSVFNRTGSVAAAAGDYSASMVTNAADMTQNYSNPSWIVTLAWGKITGAPTFLVSPLTTQGDLVVYGAAPLNGPARLPLGVNGQVLTVDSTQQLGVKWSTQALGVTSLSPGTLTGAVSLAAGANVSLNQAGQTISISVPNMVTSGGMADPTTTTGDLIVHSQSGTTRFAVGGNGQVLMADSTQLAGVKWGTITIPPSGVTSISPGGLIGAVSLQGGTNINLSQAGQVITISAASIGMTDPTTTQGDLIVHTSAGTTSRFAAGTQNGMVLITDMTQPAGLRWASSGLSAAGADMQVQVNKGGSTGADAGFIYNYTGHEIAVAADGAAVTYFTGRSYNGTSLSAGAEFRGMSARGSGAAPTATQSGDVMTYLLGYGFDGTAYQLATQILMGTTVNWTANNGAGYISFATNPGGTNIAERMRITNAGNVGIGTSNPGFPLVVAADAGANAIQLRARSDGWNTLAWTDSTGATAAAQFQCDGGNNFYLNVPGGTTRLFIAGGTGNVGIGTTSPQTILHVLGPSATPTASYGTLVLSGGDQPHQLRMGFNLAGSYGWIQAAADGIGAQILALNALGGNVGIGTSSPTSVLAIGGPAGTPSFTATGQIVTIYAASAGNGQSLQIGAQTAGPWGMWIQGSYYGNQGYSSPIALQPAGGNVGIGTFSPQYLLEVAGGRGIFTAGGESYELGIRFSQSSNVMWLGTASSGDLLISDSGGATHFFLTQTGNMGIGTTPSYRFHTEGGRALISGASEQFSIGVRYNTSSNVAWLGADASGTFQISDGGGLCHIAMMQSGNVGIGTTAPANQLTIIQPTINTPSPYNNPNLQFAVGEGSNNAGYRTMVGYVYDTTNTAYKGVIQAIAGSLANGTWLCLNPSGGTVLLNRFTNDGSGAVLQVSGDVNVTGVYRVNGTPFSGGGFPAWTSYSPAISVGTTLGVVFAQYSVSGKAMAISMELTFVQSAQTSFVVTLPAGYTPVNGAALSVTMILSTGLTAASAVISASGITVTASGSQFSGSYQCYINGLVPLS